MPGGAPPAIIKQVQEETIMDMKEMIARINFLARKKRTVGLTEGELIEQKELYELYLGNIRAQVKQKLDSIQFVDKEEPVQH